MKYKVCNIKGFEGLYHIYEDGTIVSVRKKRALKQRVNNMVFSKYSYLYVTLVSHKSTPKTVSVHRLVAHHWIQPIIDNNSKLVVKHLDRNKFNNYYANLKLVTHQESILNARNFKPWSSGRKPGFKHSISARQNMAAKKMKKVFCYNDNQELTFNSIQDCADHFKTYRKAVYRLINSHKTLNGFYIRYL